MTTPSGDGQGAAPQNPGQSADPQQQPQSGQAPPSGYIPETEYQKLRERMQAADKRAGDFEKQLRDMRKATGSSESELERLKREHADATARADAAEKRATEQIVSGEILAEAVKAGFIDPADAVSMIRTDDVDLDKNGNPSNVERLVKDLAARKSHLVRGTVPTSTDGGKGRNGSAQSGDPNKMLRGMFGH